MAKFKEFVGTPEYMSPEAIENKPTDHRAGENPRLYVCHGLTHVDMAMARRAAMAERCVTEVVVCDQAIRLSLTTMNLLCPSSWQIYGHLDVLYT